MLKKLAVAAFAGLASLSVQAQQGYQIIDTPIEHDTGDNILVQEVFWYGCPHCYTLESEVEPWSDNLADDVELEKVPATMGDTWIAHARAYYAAQNLGIVDDTHSDFFDAIHQDGRQLIEPEDVADFYSDYGVSEQEVLDALDSFGVRSQVNNANSELTTYGIMGTPAFVVDGTYMITPQTAGGLTDMLDVVDDLVDQIRSEQQ